MSSQSGITASQELLTTFQKSDTDVIIVKISSDSTQLIQDTECPEISGDLASIFPQLNKYIESIQPQPVYILIGVDNQEYAFISFIPDVAHIRDKMLYASTKNTLIQELGGGKIKKDHLFSWSELDELTLKHFESAKPKLVKEDGPLTEEEKVMKEMNSLQDLNLGSASYGKKLASMDNSSSQLLFKIDQDLESAFGNVTSKDLITFRIELGSERIMLIKKSSDIQLASLIGALESGNDSSSPSPLFALYGYLSDKLALIYTCPSASKVKDRMIYASNKQGLVTHLKTLLADKAKLDKIVDIGDPEELEISELKESTDSEGTSNKSSLKFNKPKGPRRR